MQYDFQMNAGGGQQIDVVGYFIKYKSGLGAIRVKTNVGGYVDLLPGQGVRLEKPFTSLTVIDRTGSANQGILLAGAFEFQDDAIVGTVSVVDGARNSTLSKACFMGSVNSGAVASNFNYAFLINPAASGKNTFVEALYYHSATAALKIGALGMGPLANRRVVNKSLAVSGGVLSQCYIEANFNNTDVLDNTNTSMSTPVQANVLQYIKFAEPIMVPPGMAMAVTTGVASAACTVTFEFREDPI